MARPWFKLYSADTLVDEKLDSIPPEAEGLILRMWCICNIEGRCPADPKELARKTRRSLEYVVKYQSYCASLFELKGTSYFGKPPSTIYDSIVSELAAEPGKLKRRHIPNATRRAVFARDKGKCATCGSTDRPELDHIIPHSKGGSDEESNLRVMCMPHNRGKRDRA